MKLITSLNEVKIGDIVTYYCNYNYRKVTAIIIGTFEESDNLIICQQKGNNFTDMVDFRSNPVYLITINCECGANHTSFTNKHFHWCPKYDKL